MNVLVLGLGNTLLADDGVGVHVVRYLANAPETPPYLRPIDGGTLGFRLTGAVTRFAAVIFVDAAQFNEPAGTLRLRDRNELAEHITSGARSSAHEAGLIDLLTLASLEGWTPAHIALLGIQPQRIDWGEDLSDPVSRALPHACDIVIQTARDWQ
jgi:hydrogenase maturation protease